MFALKQHCNGGTIGQECACAVKELEFQLDAEGACPTVKFPSDEDRRTNKAPDPA